MAQHACSVYAFRTVVRHYTTRVVAMGRSVCGAWRVAYRDALVAK